MPIRFRCQSFVHNGEQCSHLAYHHDPVHFCGVHYNSYRRQVTLQNTEYQVGSCLNIRNRRWCGLPSTQGVLCDGCSNVMRIRREDNAIDRAGMELYISVLENNLGHPINWPTAALQILNGWPDVDIRVRERAALKYYKSGVGIGTDVPPFNDVGITRTRGRFERVWNWFLGGMDGILTTPIPIIGAINIPQRRVTALHLLAQDNQNVHTSHVSRQTNEGEEKLLAVIVPEVQHTEKTLTKEWLNLPHAPTFNTYLKVANDINLWFHKRTCRKENDELYHRLLRGLVAVINREEGERRIELFQRVWEECKDAVGLCCEGHISRLCNVLVGFDETFTPSLSLNEQIQNEMGRISMLEVPDEEKIRHANTFFDQRDIPRFERQVWLDALAI